MRMTPPLTNKLLQKTGTCLAWVFRAGSFRQLKDLLMAMFYSQFQIPHLFISSIVRVRLCTNGKEITRLCPPLPTCRMTVQSYKMQPTLTFQSLPVAAKLAE